jgi:hypothetical protein
MSTSSRLQLYEGNDGHPWYIITTSLNTHVVKKNRTEHLLFRVLYSVPLISISMGQKRKRYETSWIFMKLHKLSCRHWNWKLDGRELKLHETDHIHIYGVLLSILNWVPTGKLGAIFTKAGWRTVSQTYLESFYHSWLGELWQNKHIAWEWLGAIYQLKIIKRSAAEQSARNKIN